MRIDRWVVLFALILPAGLQAPAGDVGAVGTQPGGESVVTQIDDATSRHVEVLNALLTQAPEPAQAGLKRALKSAREGHDAAIAALTAASQSRPVERESRVNWTDLMRARRTVSMSFHESVATLRKLMRGDSTTVGAAEALVRVKESRDVVLQNFDRLLAVRGPGLWGASSGDLGGSAHVPRSSRGLQQEGGGHCHGGNQGGGSQSRPGGHS